MYTVYPYQLKSFKKFCYKGVALTNCFSCISNFGKISKFKRGITLRKKIESKFPATIHIYTCTFTHYVLHNNKFSNNSLSSFRGVALTKKQD